MVRASSLFRMIGRPGLAHFILGCPLFPRAARPLALLLDGARSTEFCHCSGRPICDSHIDPIDSDPLPLPHPVRQPQCPRALAPSRPRHDACQPQRAVLCPRRGRHENSQRCSSLPMSKTGRHHHQPSLPSLAVDWAAGAHLGCGVRSWPCGRTIAGRGAPPSRSRER